MEWAVSTHPSSHFLSSISLINRLSDTGAILEYERRICYFLLVLSDYLQFLKSLLVTVIPS